MKNKEKLIEISKSFWDSGARKTNYFNVLIENLGTTNTDDLYEKIVLLCTRYFINCQELLDRYSDYKDSNLSEEDFRKMLYMVLV